MPSFLAGRSAQSGVSILALVVGALAAAPLPATAQEAPPAADGEAVSGAEPVIVLDTVTLTGGRAPQQISETAGTITVVDGETIEKEARAGQSLQTILGQKIPSFDPASRGARTSFGQKLRGRTALVLIDGVSLNSGRGLSRQFDSIDPFNIARVEVLSSATSLYGGNATGGIINIITKKGRDAEAGLHGEVVAGFESGFQASDDRDFNGAAAVTFNDEMWDTRISIAGKKTEAFYDGAGELIVPDITQTSLQFNESVDLFGSVGLQMDPSQRIEITGQYYDSAQESEYGLFFGENYAGLRDTSLLETRSGFSSDVEPATDRVMVNASYSNDDFLGQQLLAQAFFRSEDIDFSPFPYGSYVSASSQNTDYYGFKAALVAEPLDGLEITYGVDGDVDDFSSYQTLFDLSVAAQSGGLTLRTLDETGIYPGIKTTGLAGFAQASYDVTDRLQLSGGVRYQYVDTEVADFVGAAQQIAVLLGSGTDADSIPGGSVDYGATLFNAGAVFGLTDTQQVYANFSQGFELPDPAKYYGTGQYSLTDGRYSLLNSVDVASSALQEIQTDSFELGYRFGNETVDGQVAGYYSTSDKSIVANRQTFLIDVVDQKTRVYGVEGAVNVRLPHGFNTGANAHVIRTEVEAGGEWLDALVTDASNSKLGGHIGWTDGLLDVRLDGQHIFDLDDDSDQQIEGYTLFDLTGSYKIEAPEVTLNFGVLNLFDKDYTTIWGQRAQIYYASLGNPDVFDYKGRGRTFALSMSKEF